MARFGSQLLLVCHRKAKLPSTECSARYQGSSRRGSGEEAGRRTSVQGYFAGISAEHTLRVATTVGNSPKHRPQGLLPPTRQGRGEPRPGSACRPFPSGRKEEERARERERERESVSNDISSGCELCVPEVQKRSTTSCSRGRG